MAYNPNPPFNPSDYGNRPGGLDYQAMEDRLNNVREYIASFNDIPIRDTAAALEGNLRGQPVYGEGVPEYQSRMKDKSEYAAKGNYALPDYAQNALDQNTEYVNLIRQSVLGVPGDEGSDGGTSGSGGGGKGGKGSKGDKGDKNQKGLKLPDLDKEKVEKGMQTITEMVKGSVQNKNPSFDGMDFQDFLSAAKGKQTQYVKGVPIETDNPANPELAKLYKKLKDKGMSEDEMFKSAQYAGLTNVRTGKEGKSDFKQMLQMFNNDFMVPKTIEKKTKKVTNVGMDEAQEAFGNKFGLGEYKAALDYENQDKKYIRNYLKDYLERGGKVSDKVQALFPKTFPNNPLNASALFTNTQFGPAPGGAVMGPFQQ
jgi:hypothetical protein